jgi:hypothetical protein
MAAARKPTSRELNGRARLRRMNGSEQFLNIFVQAR